MTETEAKAILKRDGYSAIYTWFDSPDEVYATHVHPSDRTFFIIQGTMTITMDEETHIHKPGDVFTIPSGVQHASLVGPEGCSYVTGER